MPGPEPSYAASAPQQQFAARAEEPAGGAMAGAQGAWAGSFAPAGAEPYQGAGAGYNSTDAMYAPVRDASKA